MYTKILVPLDGSSLAEQPPHARILRKSIGIPVELLRVTGPDIRTPVGYLFLGGGYLQ